MDFTEYDGMILLEDDWVAESNIQYLKEKGKWLSRWRYERGANHTHADMTAIDRERVRQELKIAAGFASALREAYPDRSFVISHIPGYAVSFYQAAEDAPATGFIPCSDPDDGTAWCQTCQRGQAYRPLPRPDPEFPQAKWGVCEVCGNDLLVRPGEILTLLPANGLEPVSVARGIIPKRKPGKRRT